ncbi:glycosyltransferase [Sphaerospermopsis aphanizomenoides BCCUSP55]|uniref:glycosyltransferase n=1 Tax=Sphaerospermopsis aphanizomenoides TaxID=459663 RepID=UPI0019069FB8|nr:glycosyltransferase [Sphaerospermopsis aphanizomenoides]MBK1988962.1 glycosyltransferase [Sphaerospermopsis aphanizomenoides BCCUSP55]
MPKTPNYRIIHLSKYYPPDRGGIETHVQTLAQTQASLGAEVQVICVNAFDKQGSLSSRTHTVEEMDGDVNVIRIGRLLSLARFDVCPELTNKICQVIKQPNTLLHLHTPNPTMLMALTMVRTRLPLVITHHSDVIKQKILKYGLRPFEHLVYSKSSQVLTTSFPYIQGSKFLHFYRDKLSYLPLGLDASNYSQPNKRAIEFSQSLKDKYPGPIWLAVGRLVYYKALHIAIEALRMVEGTLVIIGVGPLESELKTLAKKLGVDKRILWLGRVSEDELAGAYQAATSLWFPSNVRSEGFGLVQVEAMASGCPVINANIPCSGVPWVSRHEQEGLTVSVNDPVALAEASQRLMYEPGLRNRLVKASRKRAEYFNHRTMAQRSFEFYEQVLNQERNYGVIPKVVDLL